MGEVWVAEQHKPIHRRVALKLIKTGMDTQQVIARFESEKQALAMMDHPAIAKVFDAGETEEGRPYFVMEYVQGIPITAYCDQNRLTTQERLELFERICEGVQHAHQKAIIHRDLKPSNILVVIQDGKAVPKIIDFGVAKATAQSLTERTMYTELGMLIGTPEYMSPEQAEMSGQNVDTRSDVYSLGAILYELLVGALPFDPKELRRAGFDEIRRKIREEDPPKPSTSYKAKKFVRRHRVGVGVASTLAMLLVAFSVTTAIQARRIARERDRANQEAEASRQVSDFLTGLFKVSDPSEARGNSVTAREILDKGADKIARELQGQPLVQTRLMSTMVDVYNSLGLYRQAQPLVEKSLEIRRRVLGNDNPETLSSIHKMGVNLLYQRKFSQAEVYIRESLEGRRRVLGANHPDTLRSINNLGSVLVKQGKLAEGEECFREVLEGRRRMLGEHHRETLSAINNLGAVLQLQGKLKEAEECYREALSISRSIQGNDHPDTLSYLYNLGYLLYNQDKLLAINQQALPSGSWQILSAMSILGESLVGQKRFGEAEPLLLKGSGGLLESARTSKANKRRAIERVIKLYVDWGKPEKTAAWRAKLFSLDKR